MEVICKLKHMATLIIIASVLVILGIVGSILPALPGPVLSYVALILLFIEKGAETISVSNLVVFGVLMALLILIDYLAPILGAKFFGASKKGIIGAVFGAFLGIVFFPPLGIFLGAFIGAVLGEFYGGKKGSEALKAGVGVLLGSASVIILQVVYSVSVAIFFFLKAF